MPKRARRSRIPHAAIVLAATALAALAGGQALYVARTDSGRLFAARHLRIGDPAQVTRLVGRQVQRGLEAVGVPRDSVREDVREGGPAPVVWRVGLAPDASPIQVNYAITRCVTERGGEVLDGRERPTRSGGVEVALTVGLPGRPTHEIVLVRSPARPGRDARPSARVALVLFGFGEDLERAADFFGLPAPFAVALPPAVRGGPSLFRLAHEREREVVLHLPLEPIDYPRISPGPATILVTMRPPKITGLVRRYLDQAGPVAAVANQMGSLATQDMAVMTAVYEELRRRRLPFLHVTPAAGAVCKTLAADLGVAYDEPDAVLDAEARSEEPRALEARWKRVLADAKARAEMVVLLRATPLVRAWLPEALSARRLEGVSVVPLTSLVRRPAAL